MGKTLEELFKTKVLENGKTAQQNYDIRNSKEAPINSSNPLLDLSFKGANAIRKSASVKKEETRFEEETTGLRIINKLSGPVIYGVDTFRLNNQKTDMVEIMKGATGGTNGSNGIIGNATNKIKQIGENIASKIGIEFPQNLIPTKIALNQSFKDGKENDTMVTLSAIKNGRENNAVGKTIGKILATSIKGPVKEIPNKLLGAGIDFFKGEVKKALYGSPKQAAQNLAKKGKEEIQYNSTDKYSETIAPNDEDYFKRNDLSSILVAKETKELGGGSDVQNKVNQLVPKSKGIGDSILPLNLINNPAAKVSDIIADNKGKLDSVLSGARKLGQKGIAGGLSVGDVIPGSKEKITQTSTVDATADDPLLRNDLSSKLEGLLAKGGIGSGTISRDDVSMNQYSSTFNAKTGPRVSLKTRLGIESADRADFLNEKMPYNLGPTDTKLKLPDGSYLDDYDFITLKFKSLATGKAVNFRATISGVSETVSPSWDAAKFIGTPFNHYTYSGIERSLTFNFRVYSTTPLQHIAAWQRINFLTSLAYPQGYAGQIGARAPFLQLTLGNLYKDRECFIESLSYSIDDNSPWYVGMTEASSISDGTIFTIDKEETNIDSYKLPMIVDVAITVKLLESKYNTADGYLYGFDKLPRAMRDGKIYSIEGDVSTANAEIASDSNNKGAQSSGADGTNASNLTAGMGDNSKLTKADIQAASTINSNANTTQNKAEGTKSETAAVQGKPNSDPRGTFVAEYKGYNIYEVMVGDKRTLTTYKGDTVFHKGNTTTNSREAKLTAEKDVIDGKKKSTSSDKTVGADPSKSTSNASKSTGTPAGFSYGGGFQAPQGPVQKLLFTPTTYKPFDYTKFGG